ncbi:MAG: hypothetical protein ACTHQE_02070 [Thermomicrobiales bacterium]
MPSWPFPPLADLGFDRIPLGPFDTRLWWLLIFLFVALVFTVQAVETAVEGAWPNQRRPSKLVPRARWAQRSWGLVAIAVLTGALLIVGIVGILIWKQPAHPDGLVFGSWLLGIGWVMFLLFSLNVLGLGRFMDALGWIGPVAIFAILLIADILLFVALREILPGWQEIRDGIEDGLKSILPFVD